MVSESIKNTKSQDSITYKGNPILSFDGAVLYLTIALFSFGGCLGIIQNSFGVMIICIVSDVIFFSILVQRFYYFTCSENDFIVQNHFIFWIKKTYSFNNLNQIAFEMPFKMPGCIRVITKDFKNSRFPAGSLSDRQWIDLKEQLEKNHVPIHDGFVYSIVFYEFVLFDEIKEIFSRFKKK